MNITGIVPRQILFVLAKLHFLALGGVNYPEIFALVYFTLYSGLVNPMTIHAL
jgi:hypothetical protein